MDLETFEAELRDAIADELERWAPRLIGERMRVFDVGCFPWFETIELSFLTVHEKPAVVAAPWDDLLSWRLYGFSAKDGGLWTRGKRMLDWLEDRRRSGDTTYSNLDIWRACAAAVRSDAVQRALEAFEREPGFLCTVFDPDDTSLFNHCSGQRISVDPCEG